MAEEIKIALKDGDKSECYVEQDAKKGDYICLQDIGAFSIMNLCSSTWRIICNNC